MAKKKKHGVKQPGANLEIAVKAAGAQAPDVVGIGAMVNTPSAGDQKVKAELGPMTGDKSALVIGAIVRGLTEDES
jgi:hypothetical protein